jgi:3-dehydroquinate dehydratase/shikimate dehydrogenase
MSGKLESLGLSINGLTVASPYKEAVLQQAELSSPISHRIGAANMFVRNNGFWEADTTDPAGVMLAIGSRSFSVKGKKAAVVGCGGAGRAIAASLSEAGAYVTLVNRGLSRGHTASRLLGLPFVPLSSFDTQGFSILVNATPVGREDNKTLFDLTGLSRDALIVDLVYGVTTTPLITNALALGLETIEGREVLMIQVIHQFRKMTGLDMPTDVARKTLVSREKASSASLAVQSNER